MGERGWGGDVGESGRVWERGRVHVGERGRVGSEVGEGGGDDCYTYYNRYVQ